MAQELNRSMKLGRQLTDDGDVAQLLVPGNVLEHLEALGDRQVDLRQDYVRLRPLAVEHADHLPRGLGAGHWSNRRIIRREHEGTTVLVLILYIHSKQQTLANPTVLINRETI
jgi:hypothetical protein